MDGGVGSVLLQGLIIPAAFVSLFLVLTVIAVSLCMAAKNRRRFPVHRTGGVVVTGESCLAPKVQPPSRAC